MRLDKFLSHATGASRSQAHIWLRHKRIRVNEALCTASAHTLADGDEVFLDDEKISLPIEGYWMLHKPQGVVCANRDGQYPTVIDLISDQLAPDNLQIAGRLDVDTTGMVLITTDGQWNHRVTAPKKHCQKIYQVQLSQPLSADAQNQLSDGLWLQGEKKPCMPAELHALDEINYLLAIYEGKYHQVKRMMAAVDNQVIKLHRLAIGGVSLTNLAERQFRALTHSEISRLANAPEKIKLNELAQLL
jgi:16S rRNA pseudouridine516 synthase